MVVSVSCHTGRQCHSSQSADPGPAGDAVGTPPSPVGGQWSIPWYEIPLCWRIKSAIVSLSRGDTSQLVPVPDVHGGNLGVYPLFRALSSKCPCHIGFAKVDWPAVMVPGFSHLTKSCSLSRSHALDSTTTCTPITAHHSSKVALHPSSVGWKFKCARRRFGDAKLQRDETYSTCTSNRPQRAV